MYFWKVERLKSELRSARLSELESLKYVLATSVSLSLLIELATWESIEKSATYTVGVAASLVISLFGTYAAYAANGGASGVDFLGRFLALGWVVGIRVMTAMFGVMVAMFGVIIAVATARGVADPASLDADGPLFPGEEVLYVLFVGVIYWRVAAHMRSLRAEPQSAAAHARHDLS